MADGVGTSDQARLARLAFGTQIARQGPGLLDAVLEAARELLDRPAERAVAQQRRDNLQLLMAKGADWITRQAELFHEAAELPDQATSVTGELLASMQGNESSEPQLQLVDEATVERDIIVSRLAQAITDHAFWEYSDLRARISHIEKIEELRSDDLFRPQIVARCWLQGFVGAGLPIEVWQGAESALKREISQVAAEAYHEANRTLIEQGVLTNVNLRQQIRRAPDSRMGGLDSRPTPLQGQAPAETTGLGGVGGYAGGGGPGAGGGVRSGGDAAGRSGAGAAGNGGGQSGAAAGNDSRSGSGGVSTRSGAASSGYGSVYDDSFVARGPVQAAQATIERFGRTMERHVVGFMDTRRHERVTPEFTGALVAAQQGVVARMEARVLEGATISPGELVEDLRDQKRLLKQAANTPAERATIEIVALLFQNILTEDHVPPSIRVWFARLQMPTLRVAVSEPDFFSSAAHPARRLIDRMGACVMGFDAAPVGVNPELEAEIRRVVQVVEAFPETGRKVFQTVLTEFERFLERFFASQNETTKKGVSLAQQVEQRETLAIQFTIELRKLLDGVPVQEGVRHFLFQVWADVLATTAVRHGATGPEVRNVKDSALELVWIASAKTTREERAEVIRRLAPLLASLRVGMKSVGLDAPAQDAALRELNLALTAAFAARAAAIDPDQFARLKQRLEALDEILPDDDFEIDDSFALDLSGHETDDLEVVAEGGSPPSPVMLEEAGDMAVGAWYMLEYRDRQEAVQLAWQGMRRQLSLFVSQSGRCVLFQKHRLASFLEAGLLTPAHDETLTTAATREAMEKINADPSRLR